MQQWQIDDEWLTIDRLEQATGVTVRNIRAYQARGLLPPPEVRARTGYYGPERRARHELIKDLQGDGLKLDTIKRLFDTTGGSTEHVLTCIRSIRQSFADESDRSWTARSWPSASAPVIRGRSSVP